MSISPHDRRKKTDRAKLDEVRQKAVERMKVASSVALKSKQPPKQPQAPEVKAPKGPTNVRQRLADEMDARKAAA
jgi:hypothetical protein